METELDKPPSMEEQDRPPIDPPKEATREECLKFLESLTQFLGAYHNHKEASAWASVGVFVLTAGQLLQHRSSSGILGYSYKFSLASILILLCGVTILFMRTQFSLRRQTARRIAACFRVRCAIIADPSRQIEAAAFAFPQGEFLPQIVLEEMRQLGSVGTVSITSLERAAYMLVLLVGLGGAVRIVW